MKGCIYRIILTVCIVLQMSVLVACGGSNDKDRDTVKYAKGHMQKCCVMEDGVFYVNQNDQLVHFVSSETHEDMAFCVNPVCEHEAASADNDDPECRAALFGDRTKIAFYDECIYYFVADGAFDHRVYRMNINSGSRELVATLPYAYTDMDYVFYGDYLYYNAKVMDEQENSNSLVSRGVLLEVNLSDGSYRTIIEREDDSNYAVTRMDVRDGFVYAVVDDEDGDYFACISLETLEQTVITENERESRLYFYWMKDDENFFYVSRSNEAGIYNMDTGNKKVLFAGKEEDRTVIYSVSEVGVLYATGMGTENVRYYFYDYSSDETWDVTEKYGQLKFEVNAEYGKFITRHHDTAEGSSGSIVGYDSYSISELLSECEKVK